MTKRARGRGRQGQEDGGHPGPSTFRFNTKCICVDTNFYETFTRDNVEAMDVKATPIERFTEKA